MAEILLVATLLMSLSSSVSSAFLFVLKPAETGIVEEKEALIEDDTVEMEYATPSKPIENGTGYMAPGAVTGVVDGSGMGI
jgi:hypothetical protein